MSLVSIKLSRLHIFILLVFTSIPFVFGSVTVQEDTISVPDVTIPPTIDGAGNDGCWANVPWQTIDQLWLSESATHLQGAWHFIYFTSTRAANILSMARAAQASSMAPMPRTRLHITFTQTSRPVMA